MKTAVVFETWKGHTEKIAGKIVDALRKEGHDVDLLRLRSLKSGALDGSAYEAYVVGASVRIGRVNGRIMSFLQNYRDRLAEKKTALYVVCLAEEPGNPERREEAGKYLQSMRDGLGRRPEMEAVFGGDLAFTKYNPFMKFMMKKIVEPRKGNIDTSKDHDYTNWDDVRSFAKEFSEKLSR